MSGPTHFARATFLLALAAAALIPSACRRGPEQDARVTLIADQMPGLGDPLRAPASEAQGALRLATAQGLVRLDPAGQVEGGLADRWTVVGLLQAGMPYREISKQTGVSVTTIGRVARYLEAGNGGYGLAARRLGER